MSTPREYIRFGPGWEPAMRAAGINTPRDVFDAPNLIVWRKLPERDNGVLEGAGGVRYHVKRHHHPGPAGPPASSPAEAEVRAWELLVAAGVPTLEMAAWGALPDGRSFTITTELTGYASCQSLLRRGERFDTLAGPTARVAALLHRAGLHHRDLYLCHFFLRESDADCRLIDVGRVARLPLIFARRWVVKDLAQFFYSAREFSIPDPALTAWLTAYADHRGTPALPLLPAIRRKADSIARHDARLNRAQPTRNVSLPGS